MGHIHVWRQVAVLKNVHIIRLLKNRKYHLYKKREKFEKIVDIGVSTLLEIFSTFFLGPFDMLTLYKIISGHKIRVNIIII